MSYRGITYKLNSLSFPVWYLFLIEKHQYVGSSPHLQPRLSLAVNEKSSCVQNVKYSSIGLGHTKQLFTGT
jgi:hypothetical protein